MTEADIYERLEVYITKELKKKRKPRVSVLGCRICKKRCKGKTFCSQHCKDSWKGFQCICKYCGVVFYSGKARTSFCKKHDSPHLRKENGKWTYCTTKGCNNKYYKKRGDNRKNRLCVACRGCHDNVRVPSEVVREVFAKYVDEPNDIEQYLILTADCHDHRQVSGINRWLAEKRVNVFMERVYGQLAEMRKDHPSYGHRAFVVPSSNPLQKLLETQQEPVDII